MGTKKKFTLWRFSKCTQQYIGYSPFFMPKATTLVIAAKSFGDTVLLNVVISQDY